MFNNDMIGQPQDLRRDFNQTHNRWHLPKSAQLDAQGNGHLLWHTAGIAQRAAFNTTTGRIEEGDHWDFPNAYGGNPLAWPCQITPLSSRAIRVRLRARPSATAKADPGILLHAPDAADASWELQQDEQATLWRGEHGSLEIRHEPFALILRDSAGKILWQSFHCDDAKDESLYNFHTTPTASIRREQDFRWQHCLAWRLQSDEVLVGGGEHFGPGNKRGQIMNWCTTDPHGTQSPFMYKPVPFVISNQGYGLLFHTTARITADLGTAYHSAASAYIDDDEIDIVLFCGNPQEVLADYTTLSGQSPVPPLWSYGLWMSRITYSREDEVRDVAGKLRDHNIPCDVIHIDTGWFEKDWCCDYEFSSERFDDPALMINDLGADGFKISLWQLPYFTPQNKLFPEITEKYAVRDNDGQLPTGDAILDYSDEAAVSWYQNHLSALLEMGVAAIKVDFGEAAPIEATYASGYSGRYEHNRYPIRYQQSVYDITKQVTGDGIIWARAAWAGCQRYPIHWGGDAESTNQGLASSIRGGLSLGLTGFSFWSQDAGGFTKRPDGELYLRWLAAGIFGSHVRTHGQPPREPWTYDDPTFMDQFRDIINLRYQLIPYLWTQSHRCAEQGQPLMRSMLLDNPDVPEAWTLDNQFRCGSDLLIAPLFAEGLSKRRVWLPAGGWVNWLSGDIYDQAGWVDIPVGQLPVIILARRGSMIPVAEVAQHTGVINWDSIELCTFPDVDGAAEGWLKRGDGELEYHQQ